MAQVTAVNWPAFGNIKNYMMVAPIYLFDIFFSSSHFQGTHFFLNSSLLTPCIAQYCLITRPSNIAQPGVCQTSDNKQFDGMRFNSSSQITHICLTLSSGALERESFRCFWPAVFMEESTANQSKLWPRGHLSSFWPDLGAGSFCKVLIFTIVKLISNLN